MANRLQPPTFYLPPLFLRWLAAAALILLAVACSPGAYPFDFLREMHYQASQRRLEPDRLSPPAGAVPVTGRRPPLTFDEAASLQNPVQRTPESVAQGRRVFQVNCGMCHGQDGRGQSVVADHFKRANLVPPADLASPRVRARTDGQLYWIVANGLGNMPPFGELVPEESLWTLVHVIREVQAQ